MPDAVHVISVGDKMSLTSMSSHDLLGTVGRAIDIVVVCVVANTNIRKDKKSNVISSVAPLSSPMPSNDRRGINSSVDEMLTRTACRHVRCGYCWGL